MKLKIIKAIKEVFMTQANHWFFVSLILMMMGVAEAEQIYVPVWIAMSFLPLIFTVLRENIKLFFVFFGFHLLLPAAFLLLPVPPMLKTMVVGLASVYAIWSITIRIRGVVDIKIDPVVKPLLGISLMTVSVIYQNFQGREDWEVYHVIFLFLYLISYFLFFFVKKYLLFLTMNDSAAANIPKKKLFVEGMKQALIFVGIVAAVLFAVANFEWLYRLFDQLLDKIMELIRAFFADKKIEGETETILGSYVQEDPQLPFDPGDEESSLFWKIFDVLTVAFAISFIVTGIILIIVKFVKYLWAQFHDAKKEKIEKDGDLEDIHEKCEIEKTQKESGSIFAFLNNRDRIRKIYKKHVSKNKNSIVGGLQASYLKFYTSKECCEKTSATELQSVYDKARYSEETVSGEDVRLAKSSR